MNLDIIIQEYSKFELQHGIEKILNLKHNLSLLIMQISKHIAKLESDSKELTAHLKIQRAVTELETEGTGQQRRNLSIQLNEDLILQEARAEGELKAYRIKLDGMRELSNSMASYLNKM